MTYAGNRILNGNNSGAIIFLTFIGLLYYSRPDNGFFLFIPIGFFIAASEAFYFEITTDELIIKNYMIPFLNIQYKLNEITQIRFLDSGYRSTAKARIEIIRGDKQSMGYKAASLGIKDWQLFIDHLTEKKISLRIEADKLKSYIGITED